MAEEKPLQWRSHVPNLFIEIIENMEKNGRAVAEPLRITYSIMQEVAMRCSEVNDPELNALMCRLTMYAIADPTNKEHFDQKKSEKLMDYRRPKK